MTARDTIAAIATAHGSAGVGIVRLSGPQALDIAHRLTGRRPRPRRAEHRRFLDADGRTIDSGLLLAFPAPCSYTGEDVIELHGHGNPVLLQALLERLYQLGVRPARPGEFTERAFLEGKLDLLQAEAVADLIDAGSRAAARAAQRSLAGEFSRHVQALQARLMQARVHVEAAIDFPEEEIDFLSDGQVARHLADLIGEHCALLAAAERGQRLRDGQVVAIIGRPNAGKSSLLNALAGHERAIVTAVPGTTRDVLREEVRLGQASLTLIDTAGLRDSDDLVEAEGIRRAREQVRQADHAVLVVDATTADDLDRLRTECPPTLERTVLFNKIDLSGQAPEIVHHRTSEAAGETRILLSLRTGAGLDLLRSHLEALAMAGAGPDGAFSARQRHLAALRRVGAHLAAADERLRIDRAGELVAEELRQAQQALSELTGEHLPDDLLGAIFASFCIGK